MMNGQDPRWTQGPHLYPPPQAYPHQGQYGQPPSSDRHMTFGNQPYYDVQPQRPAVKNPYATRALIYGIVSFVLLVALYFTNYIFLGTFGIYAIYLSAAIYPPAERQGDKWPSRLDNTHALST